MGNFVKGRASLGLLLVLGLGSSEWTLGCSSNTGPGENPAAGGANTTSNGGGHATGGTVTAKGSGGSSAKAGASSQGGTTATDVAGGSGFATGGISGTTGTIVVAGGSGIGGASQTTGSASQTTGGASQTGGATVTGGASNSAGTVFTGGASSTAYTEQGGNTNASGGGGNAGSTSTSADGGGVGTGGSSNLGGNTASGGSTGGTLGTSSGCDNQPHVIATLPEPFALALDTNYVYFATRQSNGSIIRVPIGGGAVEPLVTGELYPHELALSNGQMFWATLGTHAGHLIQAAVTGAGRKEIATGVMTGIFSLNADANNVYYTTYLNELFSLPAGGGTPIQLSGGPFDSSIVDVQLSGNQLYWTNNGVSLFETVKPQTAQILSADTSGAFSGALVTQLNYPQFEIAVDSNYVFWSDATNIYRTALIGGPYDIVIPLQAAPVDESPIVNMVSDGSHLYYADTHSVYRVPVLGGTPDVVTTGWRTISRLALDAANLYFTDNSGGVVVQIAKCATSAVAVGLPTSNEDASVSNSGADAGGLGGNLDSGDAGDAGCTGVHGCIDPSVVASVSHPYGLALDDQYVYFSQTDSVGAIKRSPIAGGPPQTIETGETYPFDIAVDADRVFWCLADSAGHLISDSKAGGNRQVLVTSYANSGVGRVTSDGIFAYVVTSYSGVVRVPVGGGDPAYISAGTYGSTVTDLGLFNGEVYWTNNGIWSDSTYTTKLPDTAYVAKAHVSGTPNLGRTTLTTPLSDPPYRVAVNATNVYYIDGKNVYRTSRAGGAAVQTLAPIAPASGTIVDMELDGNFVYFADLHGVYRLPLAGGSVTALSTGWGGLRSLAVNATSVYFTDYAGGAILRLPK